MKISIRVFRLDYKAQDSKETIVCFSAYIAVQFSLLLALRYIGPTHHLLQGGKWLYPVFDSILI
jgi:hypothetical protein